MTTTQSSQQVSKKKNIFKTNIIDYDGRRWRHRKSIWNSEGRYSSTLAISPQTLRGDAGGLTYVGWTAGDRDPNSDADPSVVYLSFDGTPLPNLNEKENSNGHESTGYRIVLKMLIWSLHYTKGLDRKPALPFYRGAHVLRYYLQYVLSQLICFNDLWIWYCLFASIIIIF